MNIIQRREKVILDMLKIIFQEEQKITLKHDFTFQTGQKDYVICFECMNSDNNIHVAQISYDFKNNELLRVKSTTGYDTDDRGYMNRKDILELLKQIKEGSLDLDEQIQRFSSQSYLHIDYDQIYKEALGKFYHSQKLLSN